MLDVTLGELFNIFYFLKKHGNFTLPELYELIPIELEIYYYMCVKERKEELNIKK